MLKDINWLGIFSLLFTLLALLLSSTLILYIFAMLAALISLLFAHYAKKTKIVKISRFLSAAVLVFWTGVIILTLFVSPALPY